jgi:hypothetical protein
MRLTDRKRSAEWRAGPAIGKLASGRVSSDDSAPKNDRCQLHTEISTILAMNETIHIPPAAIANRAYAYWEEEGHPHGRDREHWIRAERELRRETRQETTKIIHVDPVYPTAALPRKAAPASRHVALPREERMRARPRSVGSN